MTLHWNDREDDDNPEHQCSAALFAGGWFRAEVYHTSRDDEDEFPWNGQIMGYNRSQVLIGYETIDEAKRAVEAKLTEIVEEIRRTLDAS